MGKFRPIRQNDFKTVCDHANALPFETWFQFIRREARMYEESKREFDRQTRIERYGTDDFQQLLERMKI